MDLITSVAKTASTPSLLLHKNAVYREELRRKKVYLEKSLYRALGKIKHEEHILKEKRAQSWDSSESFQLRLPGFRFRANGDYKKSVSRMREERLWESLREVRKRRSLPGKESSVNIIDTSIVDGKGPPEAQTTVAEVSLAAVAAATVAAATEVAAVGARSDNRDEVGSFLHPLNTVPYTVRKVQCQLGLHYRPRAVAFLEGGNTLSPMTYKDSAMLLHKALKKPDLEDLAKGLRTKWKDREEPENSNSNSITITIREAHQESPLLRPSIGRSHVKRRCFACRYGQQCCLDEKGARHAITVVDRPRWQLVPAGKLVPQARRLIKLFSSSSDSGVRGLSQSTQLSLTNSLPVVMDRITATPLSYHQSSQMYVGLRKASDHRHSASLLATHLEDDQEDVILKIAGTNRSLSGCSSSKEDSFVNIIPSRHLGLNELKKKIKDENEVLKSKVDGFLKTLSKNTKRIFLKAALEESPDFLKEQKHYQQEEFEMVLKNSQIIERQCLSVLDFDVGKLKVCIQGERSNVYAAQRAIDTLCLGQYDFVDADLKKEFPDVSRNYVQNQHQLPLQQKQIYLLEGQEQTYFALPGMVSGYTRTDSPHEFPQSPRRSPVRDIDNNVIFPSSQVGSSKAGDLIEEKVFSSDLYSDSLVERGTAPSRLLDKTFAQIVSLKEDPEKELSFSFSTSPVSYSPDEDISGYPCDYDRSDHLYQSRLKFALKLGYSEHHLEMALEKLGLVCDEDKLLHELIENSVGAAEDCLDSPTITNITPVDVGSSEEFLGVMKKVARSDDSSSNLRHIVIDGSNVAMHHGKTVFSCSGIKIAVDWFRQRGHKEITVFVPQWRKEPSRPDAPINNQEILRELEKEGIVVFTPSRRIKGRRMVCYDDRFVLKLAAETNGIVVSNDTYRDLLNENQEYRKVVDERLLMYTFVNDRFMPPEDPLGRRGPTLDNFLRKEPSNPPPLPPPCPYGRKCTYGNKCKYYHPERGSQPHRSVTDMLKEQATIKMQEHANKGQDSGDKGRKSKPKLTRTQSLVTGDFAPTEKSGASLLSPILQEQDSDTIARLRPPLKQSGKTSDYLSEHRKRLEEALAVKNTFTSEAEVLYSRPHETSSPKPQESPSLLPLRPGSRVSSPAMLNVPYSDSQEGPLVSGHLLLAKKLSDEGSESTFFTSEGASSRNSPVMLTNSAALGGSRRESLPMHLEGRLPSPPESQHPMMQIQQQTHSSFFDDQSSYGLCLSGPACLPSQQHQMYQQDPAFSGTGYGAHYNSYPTTEHGITGDHSYREHFSLKPQQSCPPNQGFVPSTAGRPLRGMMRQNSSSDPQLHMSGISEAGPVWHQTPIPLSPLPPADTISGHSMFMPAGYPGQRTEHHARPLMRSTSMQAQHRYHQQQSIQLASFDRQMSEGVFGSQDMYGLPSPSVYPMSEMPYGNFPTTPTGMTSGLMAVQSPVATHWHQDPFHSLSPSHVSSPTRSFPLDRAIHTSDPRYPMYYNLCGIFAEPRVRAVMNKFPDETNPKKLCNSIMQLHL